MASRLSAAFRRLPTAYRLLPTSVMESSLHRELKQIYAGAAGRVEVRYGKFRVDVVIEDECGEELIEIQHGPLSAIRDKVRRLTRRRRLRIVKPIVRRKRLVKCDRKGGRVVDQRFSPKQGSWLDLFDELVYFTRAFPHRNLTIEALLVDVEEWRFPGRIRRGRQRWTSEDERLLTIGDTLRLSTPDDLRQLVGCPLPRPFHTADIAAGLEIDRFSAQRLAYVLREVGVTKTVGKQRGAWLYQWKDETELRRTA
jgi:hypothetical protein